MEDKFKKRSRRMARTKSRLPQTGNRLLVTRSCKYIFAQVIDIKTGKTLIGLSDRIFTAEKKEKMTKTENAKVFGEKFAKEAIGLKIKEVIFDRGGNLYHGRVKAFAEGAREGGLEF
ncbi:50S ribosomal protein L18 [Candidatus Shapirobacteria bacterium CG03_land_8_20_14_0_80_40_19]|uniref:Large ribosomal subunit protein uL18 n=4 Tax=Candidatus Shapironibacteriota TaxID=1752721 RepID=A0A2M7BE22_9BACT|nr:MAG: 50S ribosomal protein L18 [Candidatus Shapirobacteria bacterium CG11_big_fil_rev_8_21_14_0_20_40_12]PIV01330.1 MAG: 50S ribosomal protein L18 [Candidatus Shapirobacteria bacterium CG03_land_8_20_14_0_80_40_19]PJC29206.1 MAG: 50S ribosomal protein L18 [Candidatus Shapirobacteria bacterium CG_4_9_14_0_2_um_filter_40_11]PJC76665.1 MAG: 50S ribosomal protein L18 [Candidatus Shapirobacteria bacterium CG_4_8_14_3_um_filter_39_11]